MNIDLEPWDEFRAMISGERFESVFSAQR